MTLRSKSDRVQLDKVERREKIDELMDLLDLPVSGFQLARKELAELSPEDLAEIECAKSPRETIVRLRDILLERHRTHEESENERREVDEKRGLVLAAWRVARFVHARALIEHFADKFRRNKRRADDAPRVTDVHKDLKTAETAAKTLARVLRDKFASPLIAGHFPEYEEDVGPPLPPHNLVSKERVARGIDNYDERRRAANADFEDRMKKAIAEYPRRKALYSLKDLKAAGLVQLFDLLSKTIEKTGTELREDRGGHGTAYHEIYPSPIEDLVVDCWGLFEGTRPGERTNSPTGDVAKLVEGIWLLATGELHAPGVRKVLPQITDLMPESSVPHSFFVPEGMKTHLVKAVLRAAATVEDLAEPVQENDYS